MLRFNLLGAVLLASPIAALAHAVPTHQNITAAAVEYLKQIDSRAACSSNLNQLLQVGTAAEDEGSRPVFHFTPALSASSSSCSSVAWGLGPGVCSWLLGSLTNTHRWADAVSAAQGSNGALSEEGLRQLGFPLHLLEDLTSPAHARNDQHLNGFGVGDIDPVEAVTRTPTSPPTSDGLINVGGDVALFYQQLRTWTASNFYSKDTVFDGFGPASASEDTDYFYDVRGRRIAYKSLTYKTKVLFGQTPDPRDATINDVIATAQFAELGPVAVRYAASLIKHYLDVTGTQPQGCFVDFEKFSGPSVFTGVQPPLTSEGATFSGGQILKGATFLPRNASVVYGTAFFCPGCSPTITIDMAAPVNGVRMLLMNGQTFNVSYVVQDDKGGIRSVTLPPNSASGSAILELASRGIRRVVISSNTSSWDFFVDNITLGTGVTGTAQIISVPVLTGATPTARSVQGGGKPAGAAP
jgi:hypothetical protein